MAWYAYCITERQAFPELLRHRKPIPMEAVTGIQGNQIFLYPASDLAVIVSEHSPSQNLSSQAGVEHARVISDCFKTSTVLPFRFGTVFADDDALRRSIRSNQRQFLTNIERLRGKAEMHLKVLLDDCCREQVRRYSAEPIPTVGRAWLSNLRENAALQRERQTKARAVTVQMHRMFLPLAEEVSCKRMESGKMLLDIAHLIDSNGIERYQNKYSSASVLMKDCHMQLSGPWPPYHFVHRLTHHNSPAVAGNSVRPSAHLAASA
ncbi:MAG TPA: GvpL/GvpF family gas vesicle protein [Acidobacteriaceae bacterium]|nr:GvpL/GvpF family gas vesicle protein [Acidobacteriaceae bacterium]